MIHNSDVLLVGYSSEMHSASEVHSGVFSNISSPVPSGSEVLRLDAVKRIFRGLSSMHISRGKTHQHDGFQNVMSKSSQDDTCADITCSTSEDELWIKTNITHYSIIVGSPQDTVNLLPVLLKGHRYVLVSLLVMLLL
jgi:hypothetical protein